MGLKKGSTAKPIAQEGWTLLSFLLLAWLVVYALEGWVWGLSLLLLAIAYRYRNPERISDEEDAYAIIAPLDGRVRAIEKVWYQDQEWLKVVLRRSFWDTGIVRAPFGMDVSTQHMRYGLPIPSDESLAPLLQESLSLRGRVIGEPFVLQMMAYGFLGTTHKLYALPLHVRATERIGFILGGEVALLLPLDTRMVVALGDKVYSGESLLGHLAYKGQ